MLRYNLLHSVEEDKENLEWKLHPAEEDKDNIEWKLNWLRRGRDGFEESCWECSHDQTQIWQAIRMFLLGI